MDILSIDIVLFIMSLVSCVSTYSISTCYSVNIILTWSGPFQMSRFSSAERIKNRIENQLKCAPHYLLFIDNCPIRQSGLSRGMNNRIVVLVNT